ncbi:DUF4143 domain-containing protein [Acidithiobacillus sp. M4-SHS-6]|uniref:DUF4143 domain-containing protein n=1 Tax=Acidithiobacillus sp. M4-SHS-6 TaxID=3383024 RepID=UPI0039BDDF74
MLLARRVPSWHANVGKRLVKAPRLYWRDSGMLHALLGIPDLESLLAQPVVGASWEGFAIENLIDSAPEGTQAYYYRTSGGAEIDLLLGLPNGHQWGVEVKRSMAPRPERGFYAGCGDVGVSRRFVVYPGNESFPLPHGVEAVSLPGLATRLRRSAPTMAAG